MADGAARAHPSVAVFFGASGRAQPASGAVRSLEALTCDLSDEFALTLAASADVFCATARGLSRVVLAPGGARWHPVRRLLARGDFDLVHLNSLFDRETTLPVLALRRAGLVPRMPVLVSPRGECAPGALAQKAGAKRAYLTALRRLGLLDDVWLHATALQERRDIAALGLPARGILDAPDTARLAPPPNSLERPRHRGGPLRIVFLGRVAPVKNLVFALETLARVRVPVDFDLIGPVVCARHKAACDAAISRLPRHVRATWKPPIPAEEPISILEAYDAFFMPSLNESYGHAIAEALAAGLPVITSDRTPWRGLAEARAGWDLPLGEPLRFAAAIDRYAALPPEERQRWRHGARQLAERRHAEADAARATAAMFRAAMSPEAPRP